MRTRARDPLWWAALAALMVVVAAHFSLVLLYLLPPNPISYAVRGATYAYVVPFFAQNWWLFAPNPSPVDRAAYVRATYLDGGEEKTTPWLGLTEPVIAAVRANRLSSEHFSLLVLLNAIYSLTSDARLLTGDVELRERVIESWRDPIRQPPGLVVLERAGSAALAQTYPGREFGQIQVMLAIRPLPRFPPSDAPEMAAPVDHLVFRPVPFQRVAPWGVGR